MATEAGVFKLHLGIDVGSTTVKVAVLDEDDQIVYSVYRRHHADVRATVLEVLQEAAAQFPDKEVTVAITGLRRSAAFPVARYRIRSGSNCFQNGS